ncbi:MAG: FAD-dependent oxidoreductase [Oscillospiraceae bacterium]|nr:FAD-dependent oxidoreductase [Oscillospiraceae bacterium]
MKKVVIIGGVAGGASCAARLRRLDESAEIILLERGAYISYANCGLPYHVGDVIKTRQALLVQTPEAMRAKFDIDVRTENEAISINRDKKEVLVKNLQTGATYAEAYDDLVIATGSSPIRPPIPGIDNPKIRTLWTIPDVDHLREMARKVKSAVVIGGGFIGLEIAENLHHAGLRVSLVEALDQVMAPIDFEMAQLLHEEIRTKGVDLHLADGVDSFVDAGEQVTVKLKSGAAITAELVVLSIGIRPNSQIAKDCGLELNRRGGVLTDEHLRTSDQHIYAVGDVIEVEDFVFGDRTMLGLAGPANKQGRIAADNIAGGDEVYHGTQGTSVVKVFDLTAAFTGAAEKALIQRGLQYGRDYERLIITQNHHAGYYPGAAPMVIKLLFSRDGKKIFGAQIIGREGVDKRIDTIAVAQRMGAGPIALKELELAYAPPYSSAKDPVNMAGFVAENILRGLVRLADWNEPDSDPGAVLLDVREDAERMAYELPNAVAIPLGDLRARMGELDKSRKYIVFCTVGVRSYNAARILMQNGFSNVRVYPGGTRFYQSTHESEWDAPEQTAAPAAAKPERSADEMRKVTVDCCGMQCPGPIMEVYKNMNELSDGDLLEVSASDPGFARDIASWCKRTGNTLVSNEQKNGAYVAVVRRGLGDAPAAPQSVAVKDAPQGKTIIVFDGDMDKVLASFIIANGALAMGRPVTMFFTFWGLNALRKDQNQHIRKSPVESMFGAMLPRGAKHLSLSKMNMGGVGTAMMKKIMKDKNIDSLEALMKKAMDNGVKIIACSMSMDVMGIRREELIDGVEIGGVGTYLGDAEESNVNLFI